jgi:prepilin-type N-terminal cleavage/methylation domain-containing protein
MSAKWYRNTKAFGIVNSNKGFSLIELISVVLISSMLIVIAGVGLSVFFAKYQEINAFVELQKDGMEFLNYLKNGYNVGSGAYIQFNGVTSARALEITGRSDEPGKGTGLKITPPLKEEFPNDFIHYYLSNGVIRANYMYNGVQVNQPIFLFPKRGEQGRVTIESFKVSDANAYNEVFISKLNEPVCVVNVELKARVETAKKKYRYVHYKTTMAMKNMSRPTGTP